MFKKLLPLLVLPLLLAGCATQVTNLTSQRKVRDANNLYTLELALASEQQTLRWDSVHPKILVGTESYPMRPTPLMTNRWEGVVPIPSGVNKIQYRFKVDYEYNTFGKPKPGTMLSKSYNLQIVE
jgi:hypothetical protein